jgi:sugar phosphate isomerase/epimerase
MNDIKIGINLEFVRHADKSFDYAIAKAAELGYEYVEPCVMTGRDLLAEAGYYHFVTMEEDGLEIREKLEKHGLKASGLSAHAPLMRPDVSVPYIRQAIRFAREIGAPVVNTDEGIKPAWMSEEMAWTVMKYSLEMIARTAARYGIYVGIEPHGVYTTRVQDLIRIVELVDSPWIKINFDTGNSFLAGSDPIADLQKVADRVVHVHAKDINLEHAARERGKVTGTPVGCACGDGLVDWRQVVRVLKAAGYRGVLSVECGTEEEAARSIAHLRQVIAEVEGQVQPAPAR